MNKQTDFARFKKILVFLAEIFPRDLKPTTYVMYFATLSDLTIEQVNIAANKWARSGKFFPKPAELRELAFDNSNQLTAGDAWNMVLKHVFKHGADNSALLPPAVMRAVRGVGGLNEIGMCENGLDIIRAHFFRCYRENQEQEERLELLGEPTREEAKQLLGKLTKQIPKLVEVG